MINVCSISHRSLCQNPGEFEGIGTKFLAVTQREVIALQEPQAVSLVHGLRCM